MKYRIWRGGPNELIIEAPNETAAIDHFVEDEEADENTGRYYAAPATIEVKSFGSTSYMDFAEFAESVVQDERVAAEIAEILIRGGTYTWNELAEQEFYQEFTALDPDALRAQMKEATS